MDQLRSAASAFLHSAFVALRREFPDDPMTKVRSLAWSDRTGRYDPIDRARLDVREVAGRVMSWYLALDGFDDLVAVVRGNDRLATLFLVDDTTGEALSEESHGPGVVQNLAGILLSEYLRRAGTIDRRDDDVEWVVSDLVAYITSALDHTTLSGALYGLQGDASRVIDLGSGAQIVPITDEMRAGYFENLVAPRVSGYPGSFAIWDVPNWTHELRVSVSAPKPTPGEKHYGQSLIMAAYEAREQTWRDAITALRLQVAGQVHTRWQWQNHRWPYQLRGESAIMTTDRRPYSSPLLDLDMVDDGVLTETFEALRARTRAGRVEGALRRFDQSFERIQAADRLIDYWIALEGLFLPDGTAELSYRASLRIARYVATTAEAMRDTFEFLKKDSYGARSKVVHGDAVAELDTTTARTADVLRAALRRSLTDGTELTAASLDAALFSDR